MVGRLVTVGVYGFTAEFLTALKRADVGVLVDVRQRRGVRGSEYAWANSQRLQQALADCGIGYRHLKELAPTSEIRAAQYAADDALGKRKRTRMELSEGFKRAYVEQILEPADLDKLLAGLDASTTAALLCEPRCNCDARSVGASFRGLLLKGLSGLDIGSRRSGSSRACGGRRRHSTTVPFVRDRGSEPSPRDGRRGRRYARCGRRRAYSLPARFRPRTPSTCCRDAWSRA
jgi:hypothetical protein